MITMNSSNQFFFLERDILKVPGVGNAFVVNYFFLANNIFLLFSVFRSTFFFSFLKISSSFDFSVSRIFFSSFGALKLFFFFETQLVSFLFGTFIELFLDGLYYRIKYYRSKNYLGFLIGFSHYIVVKVPSFVFVHVHVKRRKFVIFSGDKHQLSIFADFLAGLKIPNVYMGKGLKIVNKFYRRKKILKKR